MENYLKQRRRLSAAEASCMASTAAICAASLYFKSSCYNNISLSTNKYEAFNYHRLKDISSSLLWLT
jgi:hypothetical protein